MPMQVRNASWRHLARLGFAARAIVYFLVGWFSLRAAIVGGEPSSNVGAMAQVRAGPLGNELLILVAIGMALYAVWRISEAVFDPEGLGRDAHAIFRRIGYVCSAIAYSGFAYYALRLALGANTKSDSAAQRWSAWLLHKPAGALILTAFGLGLFAAAAAQARRAWKCTFLRRLEGDVPVPLYVRWSGRIGYFSRGVLFAIIGWLLIHAAWEEAPEKAGGMRQAFDRLRDAEHGPLLLGLVAIGFCLFGLFCAIQTWFQRIDLA